MIRYRKEAGYLEWCCYFWPRMRLFFVLREKKASFSDLHKDFTAFAYRIRAPPSEI